MSAKIKASRQMQEKIMGQSQPNVTERSTFGDWLKTGMEVIHRSLWRRFEREVSNVLWKYQEQSEQLIDSQQPQPAAIRQQSSHQIQSSH